MMNRLILGALLVPLFLGLAQAEEEQTDPLEGLAQIGEAFEATAKALVARGDKAVPTLQDALQDWRPQVRQNAAVVAGRVTIIPPAAASGLSQIEQQFWSILKSK